MKKTPQIAIIYLWKGERHRASEIYSSWESANEALQYFLNQGWRAWLERNCQ